MRLAFGGSGSDPPVAVMDPVLTPMSPAATGAALRLLTVPEECGQMRSIEAEEGSRRIAGWARFNAVKAEAVLSAQIGD
jgi:hypothetical protein